MWVRTGFCKLQKGCTRFAATRDKIYQLLAHGQWFFPGTPASSTTKTGRHDVDEILLKVALNTINQKSINQIYWWTISSRGYDSPSRQHVGTDVVIIYSFACYLRNKSWKPECVLSFNMDWRILVFYPFLLLVQEKLFQSALYSLIITPSGDILTDNLLIFFFLS